MTRTSAPIALLILLCTACAEEEATPQPDPAEVERLLAHLKAQSPPDPPRAAAPAFPEEVQEKLTKTDRMVETLEKVPSERLAPSVAEALIAR